MYNALDDFHAIEAEVEAAGKTVMHVVFDVFDRNYEVMEYDGQNYCTPYVIHAWVRGSGLIAGHYFETLEEAKAFYRQYFEDYGVVIC